MKNYFSRLLTITLFLSVLFSCKKKESAPEAAPSTTGSTSTPTTQVYNGKLQAERYITWSGSSPSSALYAFKGFLSVPSGSFILTSASKEGTLMANGLTLGYMSAIKMYYDSTGSVNFASQRNFQLTSSTLPSFTYNNPDTFQVYTPSLALQVNDSLDKTKNYIIPLTGLNYFSEATCLLSQGTGTNIVSKTVPAGSSQIIFSSSDYSTFTPGSYLNVRLVLKRQNIQTFSGKNFLFECDAYNDFSTWFY